MSFNFKGVSSALLTPFENGKLDLKAFEKFVHFQIENKIDGLVVNGTTAESPTLKWDEVEALFQVTKKIVKNNIPIIVGTGSNSTEHTIETTKKAYQLGADAALVVVPYYNKPPQRGLVRHYEAVAKDSLLPIIAYNVPGRTITSLSEDTLLKISEIKNIIGVKEASGDMKYAQNVLPKLAKDFVKLSGDDETYISFLKNGGDGVISVMSNIIPSKCVKWTQLANEKKWSEVESDFEKYKPFISGLFLEANPIVPKWILYKMGIFKSPEMRLPLVELDSQYHDKINQLIKELAII